MVKSPVIMRGIMGNRSPGARGSALGRFGGGHGNATEAAVIRALEWLKDNQLEDGSWQGESTAKSKTAMTGLGLLTFLAHGETTASERYGQTVQKAIRFLVDIDQKEDGTFRHTEGNAASRGGVYAHGIASYALSEAFAMTRIPQVKYAMEKAVSIIVRGQRPDGGWDYQFARDGGERDRCTSVSGWMTQALKAAYMGGASVSGLEEALEKAGRGFKAQYPSGAEHFFYSSKSGAHRHSMTPIGVLCLQLLGHGTSSEVRRGLNAIADWEPSWQNPSMTGGILEPVYVWYYATQAYFQQGGALWKRWNDFYAPMAVNSQNQDGSWTFSHGRSDAYGPVYHTTLTALSLMVYYRYLPTYLEPEAIESREIDSDDDIDIDIRI